MEDIEKFGEELAESINDAMDDLVASEWDKIWATTKPKLNHLIHKACNQARIDELESLSKQFHYNNPRQRAFVGAINYRLTRLKCDCICHSPKYYAPHKPGHFCCDRAKEKELNNEL